MIAMMLDFDPFHVFRRMLLLLGTTYTLVRLFNVVWRWRAWGLSAQGTERVLRRWVVVSLLRIRVRRFTLELLEIGLLVMMLAALVWLQV